MAAALPDASQCISEVWAGNLYEEMKKIAHVCQNYTYIAMDTKFSGLVNRPAEEFHTMTEYNYHLLKRNADMMQIIQLGITFMDADGKFPPDTRTWQFNFKFDLMDNEHPKETMDLLRKAGIPFEKHQEEGIDTFSFAELLLTSGLVLYENIKWFSFHSGYDFSYLVRLLMYELPEEGDVFFKFLRLFFPVIYDVQYLMKSCKGLQGGLQELADQLMLPRIGQQHQAGSNSMLTAMAFFRIKELYFDNHIDDGKYSGMLYCHGTNMQPHNAIFGSEAENDNKD